MEYEASKAAFSYSTTTGTLSHSSTLESTTASWLFLSRLLVPTRSATRPATVPLRHIVAASVPPLRSAHRRSTDPPPVHCCYVPTAASAKLCPPLPPLRSARRRRCRSHQTHRRFRCRRSTSPSSRDPSRRVQSSTSRRVPRRREPESSRRGRRVNPAATSPVLNQSPRLPLLLRDLRLFSTARHAPVRACRSHPPCHPTSAAACLRRERAERSLERERGGEGISEAVVVELVDEKSLAEVKLSEAAKMRTSSYSGGMKRRLIFAIALIGDPKLHPT
ncbi:hypothetical protein Scep_015123 [Stephania cephalantha]|uniref:Uncharacterized protein n=1 Tax=Stephania cephalantha TaxID=152367 RepID=A0AAP0P036_9MAGN